MSEARALPPLSSPTCKDGSNGEFFFSLYHVRFIGKEEQQAYANSLRTHHGAGVMLSPNPSLYTSSDTPSGSLAEGYQPNYISDDFRLEDANWHNAAYSSQTTIEATRKRLLDKENIDPLSMKKPRSHPLSMKKPRLLMLKGSFECR